HTPNDNASGPPVSRCGRRGSSRGGADGHLRPRPPARRPVIPGRLPLPARPQEAAMALRDLSQGMRGEDVRAVQQGLNEYFGTTRPALDPDGVFGPNTRAAVDAFQRANPGTGRPDGSPDGIVGRRTR